METYLLDWANLLLRWAHVVVVIAWIGSSFYFVFLDSSLTTPQDDALRRDGATGELWAVHGGGFYHPVKYAVSPPALPDKLHWFYWESYSTWLTGFALFTVSYLWKPGMYLIDPQVHAWHPHAAIAVALGFLVVFWLAYDAICRTLGSKPDTERWVGPLVALLVAFAAWLACHWFAGRAAFLLIGAMLATTMTANVAHWIIPGQRKVVAALKNGQPVDPVHGRRGKQRSVHNTYFTLPVVFAMLSNHYSFIYSHALNWVGLIAIMAAGASIRQFFVLRHGYKLGRNRHPWPFAVAGVVILAILVWVFAPSQSTANDNSASVAAGTPAAPAAVNYAQVAPIFQQRCAMCHGEAIQMKGVRLDSEAAVRSRLQAIYQQAVVSKAMPLNNATGITDAERALLQQWIDAGAH